MEPNHQQPQPTIFVLFGAGGDLSWRLILPALFNLYLDKYLPEQWLLIGIDRQDYDQHSLARHYREGIRQYSRRGIPDDKRNCAQIYGQTARPPSAPASGGDAL